MKTKELTLPFHNESSNIVKLYVEPLSEFFYIYSGQQVIVTAICEASAKHTSFTIAPSDDCIIVYAPGDVKSFVDVYVMFENNRLTPDGN